ncbi:unnamed protein product [Gordionus sp. m RMFG-2023]
MEDFISSSNHERSFIIGESPGHPLPNSSIPSSSNNSLRNTFPSIPSPSFSFITNSSINDIPIPSNINLPDHHLSKSQSHLVIRKLKEQGKNAEIFTPIQEGTSIKREE